MNIEEIRKELTREEFISKLTGGNDCRFKYNNKIANCPNSIDIDFETEAEYCDNCEECWLGAIKDIKFKGEGIILKQEDVQNQKTYEGWQILKMIKEGKLKEGQELTAILSNEEIGLFVVTIGDNNTYYLRDIKDEEEDVDSWDLLNMTFVVKEKEYLTFEQARKTGKKFKYKDWDNYYPLVNVILKFPYLIQNNNDMNKLLDDKVWEIE